MTGSAVEPEKQDEEEDKGDKLKEFHERDDRDTAV
jgi:hypothetical protein